MVSGPLDPANIWVEGILPLCRPSVAGVIHTPNPSPAITRLAGALFVSSIEVYGLKKHGM